jgi:hypothetical protein
MPRNRANGNAGPKAKEGIGRASGEFMDALENQNAYFLA